LYRLELCRPHFLSFFQLPHSPHQPRHGDIMFRALRPAFRLQAAAAVCRRAVVSSLPTPTTPLCTLNFARAFTSRADIENQLLQMVIEAIEAHESEVKSRTQ
jgi:hypothetical protein